MTKKNIQKVKELYNKNEYVIGKKINTGSNITVITNKQTK